LTSPLEGAEIVAGKLWGSLYALRWLFLATVCAWLIAAVCGAMRWWDLGFQVVFLVIVSVFLLAVGVRTSLTTESATRAMALTVGIWLGSLMGFAILALMLAGIGALILLLIWLAGTQLMLLPATGGPWFPVDFGTAFALLFFGLYVVATILVVSESRVRFDRLAGRMAGGTVAVAVDRILHGVPSEAVHLDNGASQQADPASPAGLDDFEPVDETAARSSAPGRVVTPPRRPGGRGGLGDRLG
jgi:hypothetical protein